MSRLDDFMTVIQHLQSLLPGQNIGRERTAGIADFSGSVPHNYSAAAQDVVFSSITDQDGVAFNAKHSHILFR